MDFPGGSDGKESACNVEDPGLIPGLGRFPGEREWLPTPIFLPGESPWTVACQAPPFMEFSRQECWSG